MDEDWDGKISSVEFERILTGRTDWGETITEEEREVRRLAGAAARSKQKNKDEGGFQGLTEQEALEIGNRAKHYGDVIGVNRWTAVYDDTYGPENVESANQVSNDQGTVWC